MSEYQHLTFERGYRLIFKGKQFVDTYHLTPNQVLKSLNEPIRAVGVFSEVEMLLC